VKLREWANGLTLAAIIVAVGTIIIQAGAWKLDDWKFWASLVAMLALAGASVFALRPQQEDYKAAEHLRVLRRLVSVRDIAFITEAARNPRPPKDVSDATISLAPQGIQWPIETTEKAVSRASRLMNLELLQPRSSEVEPTDLGSALIAFDALLTRKKAEL
jgi:hypothetical protein